MQLIVILGIVVAWRCFFRIPKPDDSRGGIFNVALR